MNPRGRQYALAGTLTGWTRLVDPTPRQRWVLRTTYLGVNPRTYSRYGRHQWRGPLPGTRLVVKDPFAMLSTPVISAVTGALPIQVFRHPGAVLASYRRMGWHPDLAEVSAFVPEVAERHGAIGELWARGRETLSEGAQMAIFWSVLQQLALDDLDRAPGSLVVGHAELAAGGMVAAEALFERLGLVVTAETQAEMGGAGASASPSEGQLHRLQRRPAEVAGSWRQHIDARELAEMEQLADPVLNELATRRFTW